MAISTTYPSEPPKRDLQWWNGSDEVKDIMKGLYMEDDDVTRMGVTAEMKNVFAHYRPKKMEELWKVDSEVGCEDLCKKCLFFGNFAYGGCADSVVVETNAISMLTVCVREIVNRLNDDSASYDNYSTAKYLRCLSILFRNISAKHIHDSINEGLSVVDMDCDEYRKILTIPSDYPTRVPSWFTEQLDRLPANFRQYKMAVSYSDGVGVGIRKQDVVIKDIIGIKTTLLENGKLRIDFNNGEHQIIDVSELSCIANDCSVTTAKVSANDSVSRYSFSDACDSGPRKETTQPKEDEYAYLLRQMFLRDLTEDELETLRLHMGLDGKHPLEMFNCLKDANKKGFLTRTNKTSYGKVSKTTEITLHPDETPGTLKAVPVETQAVLNIPEETKRKEPLIRYSDIGKKFIGKKQDTGYKSKNPNRKHYR